MKIILGGVRGTSSTAQPEFREFGGETTSILVRGRDGETVILDAGTGIRMLGQSLRKDAPRELLLLLTHYHLDHIIGWPSFPLLYQKDLVLRVASSHGGGREAEQILSQLMQQPFWPVQMDGAHADLRFEETPPQFGGLHIRSCPVHHPGGCVAYRLDEPATGASVVLATDIEWPISTGREKEDLLSLCRDPAPCGLLLFDGQYSRDEYPAFAGWGHSCWEDAVEVAAASGVGRLLVIHHAPDSQDEQLERVRHGLRDARPGSDLACDGMEVDL